MKIVLGLLLGVALGIVANLVSGFLTPRAERNKRLVWSIFVGLVVLSVIVLFLPDSALPVLGGSSPTTFVVNQRMGPSTSIPHSAVCRVSLNIKNIGGNTTAIDDITPTVYLGNEILTFDKSMLTGGNRLITYKTIYWEAEPMVDVQGLLSNPSLPLSFRSSSLFPLTVAPDQAAQVFIDFVFDAPNSPWLIRGRLYPVNNYQEPKLPNKGHISVRFSVIAHGGQQVSTQLRSCAVFEVPTDPNDFTRTQPRTVTGE